jgi:hypothetical protein
VESCLTYSKTLFIFYELIILAKVQSEFLHEIDALYLEEAMLFFDLLTFFSMAKLLKSLLLFTEWSLDRNHHTLHLRANRAAQQKGKKSQRLH